MNLNLNLKAYWMLPSACKHITYEEVCNINFTSPDTLKKQFDDKVESGGCRSSDVAGNVGNTVEPATEEDLASLFKELNMCDSRPSILSIIPPYDDDYIPEMMKGGLPKSLNDIYNSNLLHLGFEDLIEYCSGVELYYQQITMSQQRKVEEMTRLQSKSRKWFEFRAGRVTASKMYAAMHTNIDHPSTSLLKSICYPDAYKFSSVAMNWGCAQEDNAIKHYNEVIKSSHQEFKIMKCGLFLSTEHAYIGASPDALVSCLCCGEGCVEVKCPYTHKDKYICDAAQDTTFCLKRS